MPARAPSSLPPDFVSQARIAGPEACWPWLGEVSSWGYGVGPHGVPAYVWAWRLTHRDAPLRGGYRLAQTCGNRLCVNPKHLRQRKGW